jgi:hypothetical protein
LAAQAVGQTERAISELRADTDRPAASNRVEAHRLRDVSDGAQDEKAAREAEEKGAREAGQRAEREAEEQSASEAAYVPKASFHDKTRSHILHGEVDPKTGKSHGWHYEPTGDASKGTKVIEGTRSAPDADGITEANAEIHGVAKKARSSFFPKEWTPERVEREVMEAYQARWP